MNSGYIGVIGRITEYKIHNRMKGELLSLVGCQKLRIHVELCEGAKHGLKDVDNSSAPKKPVTGV